LPESREAKYDCQMRVLYSFPHKLGADRICYTALEQIRGLHDAGAELHVVAGCVAPKARIPVPVETTLTLGPLRLPYKLLGSDRTLEIHDRIVAHRLLSRKQRYDAIHLWPGGGLYTIRAAKKLGIPTFMERPNGHPLNGYEVVEAECQRLNLGWHGDFTNRSRRTKKELAEFDECDYLLCPSPFCERTFRDRGFPARKLVRTGYGFDQNRYFPDHAKREREKKFIALYVGVDAVRKGLHFALEAWLLSPAIKDGIFMIAGTISDDFKRRFAEDLSDPSIVQLGFRKDIPYLMRQADVLFLPSLEEGYGLVCAEAIGSGCVPLVSTACDGPCSHEVNSLIHDIGDVHALRKHLTMLYDRPEVLAKLRGGCLRTSHDLTWKTAGKVLLNAYSSAAYSLT
jgi:glycosyltransferase involved in cell wall biosynthesis